MGKCLATVAAAVILLAAGTPAASAGDLQPADAIRLAEAFRLAGEVAGEVWDGWEAAPFPVLLVTADREFLVRGEAGAAAGFQKIGDSGILQGPVRARPRQFDPGLLATMMPFGPPPVIVLGSVESTGKASTDWVLTVLHEHFHQYQMSDPGYFAETQGLDLSGGDETGMWMLDYPFPYQSAGVARRFAALSRAAAALLESPSPPGRRRFWRDYARFLDRLSVRDRRYLGFQAWQEGVARYVELRAAEVAAAGYRATIEFQALADYQPFAEAAARKRREILAQLREPDLPKRQRVAFYAFGAGLALLLDQEGGSWRSRYLAEKFFLERYAPGGPDAAAQPAGVNRAATAPAGSRMTQKRPSEPMSRGPARTAPPSSTQRAALRSTSATVM